MYMTSATQIANKYDLEEVDGEIEHFTCCRDEHVTLCGKYVEEDQHGYADEVECEECNRLNETHVREVEGVGVPFCPLRPACIGYGPPKFCRNR
jgi:hypothetical protein